MVRLVAVIVLLLVIAGAGAFFWYLPVKADRDMNLVTAHAPYGISADAAALHETLRVSDLHSDMLLWMRDPAERNDRGHTDLPRLREGWIAARGDTERHVLGSCDCRSTRPTVGRTVDRSRAPRG